jgi:hypothetical protein
MKYERSQSARPGEQQTQSVMFPSQNPEMFENVKGRRYSSKDARQEEQEANLLKRKSAAHHMMFDSSTAPWGV